MTTLSLYLRLLRSTSRITQGTRLLHFFLINGLTLVQSGVRQYYKFSISSNRHKHREIAKGCPGYISLVVEVSSCFYHTKKFSECEFLSHFEKLSFFSHNFSFGVLSQFEILIFVTIFFCVLVFVFCQYDAI